MITNTADTLLPHYCCFCGNIGDILCQNCKNDIVNEPFSACLVCGKLSLENSSLCTKHKNSMLGASVVGWHEEQLKALVHASKIDSVRRGCAIQAELIDSVLPRFTSDVSVVPIPTIKKHIRQRGFGHTEIVARTIAMRRHYQYAPLLLRTSNFVQRGSTRKERLEHAAASLILDATLDPKRVYVVVDDVYTTGATISTALKLLKLAGASKIWVGVTARQPIE